MSTITIITSTYNACGALSRTAASIRSQSYRDIQWIVIDGGSRDLTLTDIRRNEDIIAYWTSEPDSGIYDAWNKACAHATGEWILFIGAGDELANMDTIERCVPYLEAARGVYDIVYGKIQLITTSGETIAEVGAPWISMKGSWGGGLPLMPPHPSSFHHRSLFRGDQSFDSTFRYAGDSAFVVQNVLERDPLFVPIVVDRMVMGGVTARPANILAIAKERRRISLALAVPPSGLHVLRWYASLALQVARYTLLRASVRSRTLDLMRVLQRR